MQKLKSASVDIVCQEVPDEISLVFNISNCPYHCPGCHSSFLWEDIGEELLHILPKKLEEYDSLITCVCFMGGDQNINELTDALKLVKAKHLKTCLYTGASDISVVSSLIDYLDFLKLGPYIEECGGLDKPTTNQRFYRIENGQLIDETYKFIKKYN